jgi:hypothetical protein
LQEKLCLPRHALHAARLGVPWSGRWLEWEAALAGDLADFIAGKDPVEIPGVVIWSRHD